MTAVFVLLTLLQLSAVLLVTAIDLARRVAPPRTRRASTKKERP